jgi:hypothetical protein
MVHLPQILGKPEQNMTMINTPAYLSGATRDED